MRKIIKIDLVTLFRNNWRKVLLVVLVVMIAYGKTLLMYFWQDDSALIFKLQNPEGIAGSFGEGIIGSGAYKYLVTPFVPFFPLFGLEPFGYFLVGLLSYLLVVWTFWLFAGEFVEGKRTAYISTLIFAGGYLGSDIMFRVINSWQTNIGLFFGLLCLWRLTAFVKNRTVKDYFWALLLYFLATEFVFIRSHGLILPIVLLDALFLLVPFKLSKLRWFIIRQLPFVYIFAYRYLSDAGFGAPGIGSLFKGIFLEGKVELALPLIATSGYGFIQNVVQTKAISIVTKYLLGGLSINALVVSLQVGVLLGAIWVGRVFVRIYEIPKRIASASFVLVIAVAIGNYALFLKDVPWYRSVEVVVAGLVGGVAILLSLYYGWYLIKRKESLGYALIIGSMVLVSQVGSYYIQYPTSIFPTHHRYFSYSIIGYALFYGVIIGELVYKKGKLLAGAGVLVLTLGVNLFLGYRYQSKLVETRSIPSREFYEDLKQYVPSIEKGATFYFDVSNEARYARQFGDSFSVGSMPETTALAIYYGVDRYDLVRYTDFDELVFNLSEGNVDMDNLYTFYYGEDGLVDTTERMKDYLMGRSASQGVEIGQDLSTTAIETSPLTPVMVTLDVLVGRGREPLMYPYSFAKPAVEVEDKGKTLDYLVSRQKYYASATASSVSEWKYREVEQVVDNDFSTVWQGHRIWWYDNRTEELVVDSGSVKMVGGVFWKNWKSSLAPTKYAIDLSIDGVVWDEVFSVEDGGEVGDGEWVRIVFEERQARYVRMRISETFTNDSPSMVEFELVESGHEGVDPEMAMGYQQNPFGEVRNSGEWNLIYDNYLPLAEADVIWKSDKNPARKAVKIKPVFVDGVWHRYSVVLPAGGTEIADLMIKLPFPAEVRLGQVNMRNMSLREMVEMGMVKEFEEN